MAQIDKTIAVEQPVQTVYNQWTQFEEFPQFMEGVEKVIQLDDKRLHWVAKIGPVTREWDAEITQQVPDQVIAWRSTDGTPNGGEVRFRPSAPDRTDVTLVLEFEPQDVTEKAGSALGIVEKRAQGDLERFKEFVEERGQETGAWRGRIDN